MRFGSRDRFQILLEQTATARDSKNRVLTSRLAFDPSPLGLAFCPLSPWERARVRGARPCRSAPLRADAQTLIPTFSQREKAPPPDLGVWLRMGQDWSPFGPSEGSPGSA